MGYCTDLLIFSFPLSKILEQHYILLPPGQLPLTQMLWMKLNLVLLFFLICLLHLLKMEVFYLVLKQNFVCELFLSAYKIMLLGFFHGNYFEKKFRIWLSFVFSSLILYSFQ